MKTIFKEGDRVFHIQHGWGAVVFEVSDKILVKFDNVNHGRGLFEYTQSNNKALSFTEYTLNGFSQERPEELPNKGQIVWVRKEFPSEWTIGHFIEKIEGYYFVSVYPNLKDWNYKGVEIRTTNPYEDEQD